MDRLHADPGTDHRGTDQNDLVNAPQWNSNLKPRLDIPAHIEQLQLQDNVPEGNDANGRRVEPTTADCCVLITVGKMGLDAALVRLVVG